MIEIPKEINDRLRKELRRGGIREIGGILMGECLEPGRFRVVDFTVNHGSGSIATFVRSLGEALQALTTFFKRTGNDYRRFNYLGEWHSHPSFAPFPSSQDIESVQSIADDPTVDANFVALLIVKLNDQNLIDGSATIFQENAPRETAMLLLTEEKIHVR